MENKKYTFEEAKKKLGELGVGLIQDGERYILRWANGPTLGGQGDTLEWALKEGIRRQHEGRQRPLTSHEMSDDLRRTP